MTDEKPKLYVVSGEKPPEEKPPELPPVEGPLYQLPEELRRELSLKQLVAPYPMNQGPVRDPEQAWLDWEFPCDPIVK